ncbi:helix-turn-helix domain-containing protein [Sphingomonas canadensis]|uniref:Helix-turn-helix domain-containing protein n=1 Tax=Sphingomonas canadensis TaxID=1219257 RepID=A0ABW3HBE6_9SPHN|nr:AraC family transcriptional regulator [Sphingomonas canadensis]MCW3838350.1 AraC family transcriptional regulator [Sphingomonas canadensis]
MSTDPMLIEAMVRGIACGGFLATALIIARVDRSTTPMMGALFHFCRSAHVIAQFPPAMAMLGGWYLLVDIPSIAAAPLSWIFVTEFFGDTRSFNRSKLAVPALVLAIGLTARLLPPESARVLWLINNFINVGLFAHITATVLKSWNGDLVEQRRLAVAPLFLLNVAYGVAVALVQTVELFTFSPRQPSLFAALALVLISGISVWIFGRTTPGLFKTVPRRPVTGPSPADPQRGAAALPEAEAALVAELERLMRVERLYRIENLRISALAMRLGVTEHRLRKLLNGDLGYRNFSAYVAYWRLDEAKQALEDPEQREVPISTIALDSGFQSLAPFNRAFKADTGLTPTSYRRRALKAAGVTPLEEPEAEAGGDAE